MLLVVGVVINEVMYDPQGPESSAGLYNEAVELFNDADTTVCLNGFKLGDKYDLDPLQAFPDSTVLSSCPGCVLDVCIPAGGFGVVLDRDYTNPSSPDPMPYTFPSGTVLLTVSDASIGNGLSMNDSLFLISPSGDTVDVIGGLPRTGDGISAERRSPTIAEFLLSRSPSGHTLGFGNSVSCPYEASIKLLQVLKLGESYRVSFEVKNTGTENQSFPLTLYWNSSADSSFSLSLQVDSADTLVFSFPLSFQGTNEVSLSLDSGDCFLEDNSAYAHFVVVRPSLVINEINYKGIEWFELYNLGEWPLNFEGLLVHDASGHSDPVSLRIEAGGYTVLTGDSSFSNIFPSVPFTYVSRMPRLNDSYEDLFIVDGVTLDSVHYTQKWGGDYNRSLERISPFLPSNDSTNWGTCRDPSGGTPGRANSLTASPPESGVKLGKEIYRAGEGITLAFSYPFKVEEMKVTLYDDLGRKVKEETFRPLSPVGQIVVNTDGLWRGLYFIHLSVKGEGNSREEKLRFSIR